MTPEQEIERLRVVMDRAITLMDIVEDHAGPLGCEDEWIALHDAMSPL